MIKNHFQVITTLSESQRAEFISFCVKSKPYDRFGVRPVSIARKLAAEFLDELLTENTSFGVIEDGCLTLLINIIHDPQDTVFINFIYGKPDTIIPYLHEFMDWYRVFNQGVKIFKTDIARNQKKNALVRFLTIKDKKAKLSVDDGNVSVYWMVDG